MTGDVKLTKISVDLERIRPSISELEAYTSELKGIAGDVEGIRGNIRFKILSRASISSVLRNISAQISRDEESMRAMYDGLEKIASRYSNTERSILNDLEGKEADGGAAYFEDACAAYDGEKKTFDNDSENGGYGANQNDMTGKTGIPFLGTRLFEDKELYAFIRRYPRYQNYSEAEITALIDQISEEGCGYVALVNNLFAHFEGREEEFEHIFGFPMYNEDGEANYNYLLLDIYANTDDQYYLDESTGESFNQAFLHDVISDYEGHESEYREKYGCDSLNREALEIIWAESQKQGTVTIENSGVDTPTLENRFNHYMKQKGISCNTKIETDVLQTDTISQYLEKGEYVNINTSNFKLYDENGKPTGPIEGHWMMITDVTEDGQYIVSSWGERYYLNPSELDSASYLITDINF